MSKELVAKNGLEASSLDLFVFFWGSLNSLIFVVRDEINKNYMEEFNKLNEKEVINDERLEEEEE